MGVEAHASLSGGVSIRHMGSTHRGWPGEKASLRPPVCWTAPGEDVLWWVLGSGCVLSLGGHMEMQACG